MRANDWKFVLYPLKQQIRALQSTKCRWADDPHREPVFSAYLSMLLKVRARIGQVRALSFGKTIPQIAKECGLPLNGLRWTAYVPEHIKERHTMAFERLYKIDLPDAHGSHRGGKRLVPFSTKAERNRSDGRWDALFATVIMELEGRASVADEQRPLIDALEEARAAISSRGIRDEAPYGGRWEMLLRSETLERLEAWRNETMDGLDAHKMLEAQRAQQTDGMLAADAEKKRKRAQQKECMARYRAKKKAGEALPTEPTGERA